MFHRKFEKAWGWVNDDWIFLFGWNYPFKNKKILIDNLLISLKVNNESALNSTSM